MNLIFVQMKVYFELNDISEYQCRAYLHLLLLLLTPKVSPWWTLFKLFFLNDILTILCLWLSILGGTNVYLTQEPSNPSYFNIGSDANLVWDYTDPHNEIQFIVYSVVLDNKFAKLILNDSQGVRENPNIPSLYKGRVEIKGRATLVIKNINPRDNSKFKCEMRAGSPGTVESAIQLIVAGTYYKHNH